MLKVRSDRELSIAEIKKEKGDHMKKIISLFVALGVIVLIIFTLQRNKAEMVEKAKIVPVSSYPVSVVMVSKQNIDQSLVKVGVIAANNDVTVVSKLQGKVTAVFADQGTYVSAGSPIVKIEDQVPQANFSTAKINYQKAQKDLDRNITLHGKGLISDSELEEIRLSLQAAESQYVSAQDQYQNSVIIAPISGIITSRNVNLGTTVSSGMIVANVVDISQLRVNFNIGEKDVFKLKAGDPVTVETDVYPRVQFYGKILDVSVKGDQAHTYPVQIIIPNSQQHPLKAGMFAKVIFHLSMQTGLIIPRDALVGSIKEPKVFVAENGIARLREILVDSENGTNLVVGRGLSEGATVVVSGQEDLHDNATVRIMKESDKP